MILCCVVCNAYSVMNRNFYQLLKQRVPFIALMVLILAGCAPRVQEPIQVGVGKESVGQALSTLRSRRALPLKATGRCRLQYYAEGKPHKENFAVRLWMNPPAEIRLHGDVAFNARGIDLGSNESEFWLSVRPKQIRTYWWGQWADQTSVQKLMINPRILLEAIGIIKVGDEEGWTLSNEGVFDVLVKRNDEGTITKKIYVYSWDYSVRKIEYFDNNGEVVVVTELDKYKQVSKRFYIPTIIKITTLGQDNTKDFVRIGFNPKSIKLVDFVGARRDIFFNRPGPKGFKHIYKIINGKAVEQPQ